MTPRRLTGPSPCCVPLRRHDGGDARGGMRPRGGALRVGGVGGPALSVGPERRDGGAAGGGRRADGGGARDGGVDHRPRRLAAVHPASAAQRGLRAAAQPHRRRPAGCRSSPLHAALCWDLVGGRTGFASRAVSPPRPRHIPASPPSPTLAYAFPPRVQAVAWRSRRRCSCPSSASRVNALAPSSACACRASSRCLRPCGR